MFIVLALSDGSFEINDGETPTYGIEMQFTKVIAGIKQDSCILFKELIACTLADYLMSYMDPGGLFSHTVQIQYMTPTRTW